MQGIGNDYVYINCFEESVLNAGELSKKLSDRHFGIGSDGLILICPSEIADFKMKMFNSDGSESEMCGNGIRCVGKYVYEKNMTKKTSVSIETLGGVKYLELEVRDGKVDFVTVDMGEPKIKPEEIPVAAGGGAFIDETVSVDGRNFNITCVSMGNPHAVIFVDDLSKFDLYAWGPKIENHKIFPKRTNVEFAQIVDRETIKMSVWERGAGETLACGTGACAVLVAAVLNKKCENNAKIVLKGGELYIRWDKANNRVFMKGPAEFVFEGAIQI